MNKIFTYQDLVDVLGPFEAIGDSKSIRFNNVSTIEDANENSIVWIRSKRSDFLKTLKETKSRVILCEKSLNIPENLLNNRCFVLVDNPKLSYLKLVNEFFHEKKTEWAIHPTAIIDNEAIIAENVYIGPYCVVGKSIIDENVILKGNCTIGDNVKIGKNVVIHQNTIIGSDGFGFVRGLNGKLEKFIHLGTVIIEENVEIYPFVNIDKGTLGATIIKSGSKIDHFCHIGHNSKIGYDSLITASTVLCGGATIGDRSWIGVQSIVKEKITVGNDVTVGLGSVVTKNIPNSETWLGSPAKEINDYINTQNKLKKL